MTKATEGPSYRACCDIALSAVLHVKGLRRSRNEQAVSQSVLALLVRLPSTLKKPRAGKPRHDQGTLFSFVGDWQAPSGNPAEDLQHGALKAARSIY